MPEPVFVLGPGGAVPQGRESEMLWEGLQKPYKPYLLEAGLLPWPSSGVALWRLLEGAGAKIEFSSPEVAAELEKAAQNHRSMRGWNSRAQAYSEPAREPVELPWEVFEYSARDLAEMAEHSRVLIAYEAGLSKTRTSLSLAWLWRSSGSKVLIVCPKRLIPQWRDEIAQIGFDMPFELISYEQLYRSENTYPDCDICILDEAQAIKNPHTRRFEAVAAVAADYRIALTATPTGGKVEDLVGITEWLCAGDPFLNPLRRGVGYYRSGEIGLRAASALRRELGKGGAQTPVMHKPKLDMEPELVPFYLNQARLTQEWWLEGGEAAARLGLDRLIQAASCPQNLGWAGSETRLQKYILETARAEVPGVIVFTRLRKTAEWYAERLGVKALHGGVAMGVRAEAVQAFRQGKTGILVATLGVLAEGWNLPEGHCEIFAEIDWNPATVEQALYRVLRPQQKREVHLYMPVYKLSALEHAARLVAIKQEVMHGVLKGESVQAPKPSSREILRQMVTYAEALAKGVPA